MTGDVSIEDDELEVSREEVIHVGMQSWTDAIESCPTFSRLHLLLCIFDSCIKWEKSAENAVGQVLCYSQKCAVSRPWWDDPVANFSEGSPGCFLAIIKEFNVEMSQV